MLGRCNNLLKDLKFYEELWDDGVLKEKVVCILNVVVKEGWSMVG